MRGLNSKLFVTVLAVLFISVVVFIGSLHALPWLLSRVMGPSDASTFSAESLFAAAGTVTAALGAAVFLVVNYRKQSLNERQDERSVVQGLVQDFNAYAKDLTQQTPQAVAALNGLASTTDQLYWVNPERYDYRQRCVNIFCAFIRSQVVEKRELAEIKQAEAFRIIKEHVELKAEDLESESEDDVPRENWRSCKFNLPELVLYCPLRIENCVFEGQVDLWGAEFERSVYARGVHFERANFNGTTFKGKRNEFNGAVFGAVEFQGNCTFSHTITFDKARFKQGVAFGSQAKGGALSGVSYPGKTKFGGHASFKEVTFNAAANTVFENANFECERDLTSAKFLS